MAYVPHIPRSAILYQHAGYALALFGMCWHGVGLWLILRSGLAVWLRQRISARLPELDSTGQEKAVPPFRALALFYAALSMLVLLWMLPVGLADLGIEHHFGFSRQSLPLYLGDLLRSWLVGMALLAALWIPYRLYALSPRHWWLWLWAILIPLILFSSALYPELVSPVFHRYSPLQRGELRRKIETLAFKAGIPHATVLVEDTSRRTQHVNAYVIGIGATSRIVIDDTALRLLPEDEILAMVGHEIGHYVEGHVWIGTLSSSLGAGLFLWLFSRWLPGLMRFGQNRYGIRGPLDLAALPLFLLVIYCCLQLQMPIANLESRWMEHRADAYGLRLTHLNEATARLFVGFAERDYSDPDPPLLLHLWYGTHPTLRSRIAFALSYRPYSRDNSGYRS